MSEAYPPPPPPYEASQLEFDQKTSHAIEVSLSITEDQHLSDRRAGEDGWELEEWDEAAFEAAHQAAARQRQYETTITGSSSARGSAPNSASEKSEHHKVHGVEPLRIHKKNTSDPKPKERPSWFEEANLGDDPPLQPLSGPSSPYGEGSRPSNSGSSRHRPQDHEDEGHDQSLPPPPFEPVGPNLDGPPFDEVVMAYHGNDSAPPSPLASPPIQDWALPSQQQSHHLPRTNSPNLERPMSTWSLPPPQRLNPHSSLPPPARHAPYHMGPRPVTSFSPATRPSPQPRMTFDHSLAYTRTNGGSISRPSEAPRVVNASAFYNSAVSSHLGAPSKPAPRVNQSYHQSGASHRQSTHPSQQPYVHPTNTFASNTASSPIDSSQYTVYSPYQHGSQTMAQGAVPVAQQYTHPVSRLDGVNSQPTGRW